MAPAITKEAQSIAPFCELALHFPFGVFHGLQHLSKRSRRAAQAGKRSLDDSADLDDEPGPKTAAKKPKTVATSGVKSAPLPNSLTIQKAKHLLDKSKNFKAKTLLANSRPKVKVALPQTTNSHDIERRATWTPAEDHMILLVKVTALFFMPNEKSIQCKLLSDVMNALMPGKSLDKKATSYGRRVKILMRSKRSYFFVSSKLELCKQVVNIIDLLLTNLSLVFFFSVQLLLIRETTKKIFIEIHQNLRYLFKKATGISRIYDRVLKSKKKKWI